MKTREQIEEAITNFVKGRVNRANSYVSYNSLVLDTDDQWKSSIILQLLTPDE